MPTGLAAPPLVRVQGVSKAYREGGLDTPVLRNVSLDLGRGETTSLVGASGSGKSTLLGLIAGLLLPDSGTVTFEEHALADLNDTARARVRSRRVGVVLQSGNLIPFLTAAENVELAIELAGAGDDARAGRAARRLGAERARDLLGRLGLADRADHLPRRLSGGEAQRAAVAVALANEPDLLLADEATGELDSSTADQVMGIIVDAWRERGLTVLYVTHSRELAARAQHRLALVDGEVGPV